MPHSLDLRHSRTHTRCKATNMMLAQLTGDQSTYAVLAGFGALVLTKIGEWITGYFKYRRDKELDKQKQEYLKRSAESNEALLIMTTRVEANLQFANRIGDERHNAVLTALDRIRKNKP